MSQDFSRFLLREFVHWNLFIHRNQFPYLGRCYAWAKRDVDSVVEMNLHENLELFREIIPLYDKAIKDFLGVNSGRLNLAVLGNESPHLHAHLIPRLSTTFTRYDISFSDPNPGGNYAPYPKK